jgi:predicted Zn-dependent protease
MVVLWEPDKPGMQANFMKKVIIQGLALVVLFFASWFLLSKVDWITEFNIERATKKTEEKLGDIFWESFSKTETESKELLVVNSIDSIVTKICTANDIKRANLKVHVLEKDEVNAFALPNGHLVIYSGLILAVDNPEELSGVICHEIAHIELNHVMKKLVKEMGLSVLISMTTGNISGEVIKETAKMLSSSAFDRSLEQDADLKAVDYLVKAEIDPESLANFLYKLSTEDHEVMKYLSWMSTHPDSRDRAEYIVAHAKGRTVKNKPVLSPETWTEVKEQLK